MPTVKLPLSFGINKDVEEVGLATQAAAQVNLYTDSAGSLIRTPGLVEFVDLGVPAGIDGLCWWDRQGKAIAQCGGRHFQITDANGTFAEISGDTAQTNKRVYYADFGTALYLANGGNIIKIPSSGNADAIGVDKDGDGPTADDVYDADVPGNITHVAVLDKYLLALPANLERMEFSEVLNPDSFEGDWITPESKPDLTKAIGVANDRIELFGTNSLEGWRNDGRTPFVKDSAFTVDRGIAAPHSLQWIENTWYWIDDGRRIVRLSGRSPENISVSLNTYLQRFSTVADAIGGTTTFNGRPQYILSFPTEDKTICFDVYSSVWFELGRWNSTLSQYNRFVGNAFCSAVGWNLSLVGDRSTGKIYKLDSTNYQESGSILRGMLRTPVIHHGDPTRFKRSGRLDFYINKTSASGDIPNLTIRWRDDGSRSWQTEQEVPLGMVGELDYFGQLIVAERYKSRQYEIAISDNTPVTIVSISETFDWLGQ